MSVLKNQNKLHEGRGFLLGENPIADYEKTNGIHNNESLNRTFVC